MSTASATSGAGAQALHLDDHGCASLDGTWQFFPGDHDRTSLARLEPSAIEVPGLWEAQGHLELDGVAWYRHGFVLDDAEGWWTLRFGAVMDQAVVFLNGVRLGRHDHPFTPFELPVTGVLREGANTLEVRVTDPSVDDPAHIRSAHGKQGWANHVFPSRPSLYMTYGGIWQGVTLRRHGPVTIHDVFVNGDPDDLRVTAEVRNHDASPHEARVGVRLLGLTHEQVATLAPGGSAPVDVALGATPAERWSPALPHLHHALVDLAVDGATSDSARVRFGLRVVRVEGRHLTVGGEPYRMKSVLVQGFRADRLYAEGTREQVAEEVRAAQAMGFNTLRLHIKAFDPVYLDVCDELGMLVHSDLPVAEPIAHEELGDGSLLSRTAVGAVTEQVVRDRNHPCIVLWSAMNELGLDREGVREWPAYEEFARTLYAAVTEADPTRPVIENDWVEPSPERVFCSPVLTAHWYGRLHADYLDKLEAACRYWADLDRPLFVTEFGDWGLPPMPPLESAPFWDTHAIYAAGLAQSRWPSSVSRFVRETQRYQGLSDRLQIEVFRRHEGIGGYCLTELTDVPHELNGVLDLHRQPKELTVEELTRANQPVLPILELPSLVVAAGGAVEGTLHVSNDGPPLEDVVVLARFGDSVALPLERMAAFATGPVSPEIIAARFTESVTAVRVGRLEAYRPRVVGPFRLPVPEVAGNHDALLQVSSGGRAVGQNRYPVHVVVPRLAAYDVRSLGGGEDALVAVGARPGERGPLVVAEGALSAETGPEVVHALARGDTVVVLAQGPEAAPHYPLPVAMSELETAWGSTVFHFSTDSGALPSLPRRNLLAAEESTVQARCLVVGFGPGIFPHEPVVIAYKPVPSSLTGWVVGAHRIGAGRLIVCQYRLAGRVRDGDVTAMAVLADLVSWAAAPLPTTQRRETRRADGRAVTYYSFEVEAP